MANKRKYDNTNRAKKAAENKAAKAKIKAAEKKAKQKASAKRNKAIKSFRIVTKAFNKIADEVGYNKHSTSTKWSDGNLKSLETIIKQTKAAEKKIKNFNKYGVIGISKNQISSMRSNMLIMLDSHKKRLQLLDKSPSEIMVASKSLDHLEKSIRKAKDRNIAQMAGKNNESLFIIIMDSTSKESTEDLLNLVDSYESILNG